MVKTLDDCIKFCALKILDKIEESLNRELSAAEISQLTRALRDITYIKIELYNEQRNLGLYDYIKSIHDSNPETSD